MSPKNGRGALREALIIEAVRTPVARGHKEKGIFRDVHPADLLGRTYTALIDRAGIAPEEIENVIAGCVHQVAEQSTGITRTAWLQKGLPESTGATTVDIRCGSSQQATHYAAMSIATHMNDVVVAAGVEHMGRVGFPANEGAQEQWGRAFSQELLDRYDLVPQGIGAEMIADRWEIGRAEMDEFALRSHRLADAATTGGLFEREIVPIEADGRTHVSDQGIRPDTSLESLSALKPAFRDGGQGNRRELVADLGRRLGCADDERREGRRARPASTRAGGRPGRARRRPGDDAHRPDPRHRADPRAQRDDH